MHSIRFNLQRITMSENLNQLLENNQQWVKKTQQKNPEFFNHLGAMHAPKYLWIGCADARVPANTIVNIPAGDLFVHRNVGNVVSSADANIKAVISYAVRFLKVKHIIVTGHYDCGAVKASLEGGEYRGVDHWLHNIKIVIEENKAEISAMHGKEKIDRTCELNVQAQVKNVSKFDAVQEAWTNGEKLTIHGWVYAVENGLIKDLNISKSG